MVLVIFWCSSKEQSKNELTVLNENINIQEQITLTTYKDKTETEVYNEKQKEKLDMHLSEKVAEYTESEKKLNDLYVEKRNFMEKKKESILYFTGDRE